MKLTFKVEVKQKRLLPPVAKIQKAIEYYANEVRNEVIDNIIAKNIIDTGNLLNSVQTDSVSVGPLRAEIGTRVQYAIYNELGTSKMKARPFFQPAYDKVKPEFIKAIEKLI